MKGVFLSNGGTDFMPLKSQLPDELFQLIQTEKVLEQSYLVGGSVRDGLSGGQVADFDIEVFAVDPEVLETTLRRHGRVDVVGKSFGVFKLLTQSGLCVDFSLPRTDSKHSVGHRGFNIRVDPGLTPREAASRRDFTINAVMYHILEDKLLDYFNGMDDMQSRILRHVGPAFVEDPLRVLRGFQLAGRFALEASEETLTLCREMVGLYPQLSVERVGAEWLKWAELSRYPSFGLRFLEASGWIQHYPELAEMRSTPQDPEWHPEGDVYEHTCLVCDAMANCSSWKDADARTRRIWMLTALTHDIGKPEVTQKVLCGDQIRITSPRHEKTGVKAAEIFMGRIHVPPAIRTRVKSLVREHMVQVDHLSPAGLRRLSKRLEPESVNSLCVVLRADTLGRPVPSDARLSKIDAFERQAVDLNVSQESPKPFLMGKHLIQAGLKPGPIFTEILQLAYESQLNGRIRSEEEAKRWLVNHLESL